MPMIAIRIATFVRPKGGYVMKRALICSIGVTALMAGVQDVYVQARPAGVNASWEWHSSVGPVRRGRFYFAPSSVKNFSPRAKRLGLRKNPRMTAPLGATASCRLPAGRQTNWPGPHTPS